MLSVDDGGRLLTEGLSYGVKFVSKDRFPGYSHHLLRLCARRWMESRSTPGYCDHNLHDQVL